MQCERLKTYMETGRVVFLPPRAIRPNPSQPRKYFEEKAMEELADSIRQHGILQPLSVRRMGNIYELIAGERRLRAAVQAGLPEVPCILMQMDEKEQGLTAMVENLQRQDLNYLEEATGILQIMEKSHLTQEQTARLLGKSQSTLANKLRILKHSQKVLDALEASGLSERHARALLRLPGEEEKLQAIKEIDRQSMSVARAEQYISSLLEGKAPRTRPPNIAAFLTGLTRSLQRIQKSGIPAVSERRETEKQIIFTITIQK